MKEQINSRYNLTSVVGGEIVNIIEKKTPSNLIPFKGEFPLLPLYKADEYYEIIHKTPYVDKCPQWVQDVILKGQTIFRMEESFKQYLRDNNIDVDAFKKKSSADKSTELIRFFNANSLSLDSLKV